MAVIALEEAGTHASVPDFLLVVSFIVLCSFFGPSLYFIFPFCLFLPLAAVHLSVDLVSTHFYLAYTLHASNLPYLIFTQSWSDLHALQYYSINLSSSDICFYPFTPFYVAYKGFLQLFSFLGSPSPRAMWADQTCSSLDTLQASPNEDSVLVFIRLARSPVRWGFFA
ncbi:unnamed protein product [Protopolystoma xenopodis]|uniref:Uncharacterized protein n=1 Tax=Protopolystoma xenopodis TaxID=117903 RepID=A0A3S5BAA4_9PLAT|nr:unnamed protein product [Protopolystoma xenopodis]